MIKNIDGVKFKDKRVLVRVDFNVPLDENSKITDATRIKEALPTIDKIIDDWGIPVLMSHFGRPKGEVNPKYSLKPVADYLRDVIGYNVKFANDCIGHEVKKLIQECQVGDVVLLENLRFHKGEEKNDEDFAAKLAELGDSYINDAFGTAHRAHASTVGITAHFTDKFAGYLLEKEIKYFEKALHNPSKPFISIIGGSKISGKIDVIKNLMKLSDTILIGGGMMFTFYKAMGYEIGNSILEQEKIDLASEIINEAKAMNVELLLPSDVLIADNFSNAANTKIVSADNIPEAYIGMDIGPKTIETFTDRIINGQTVIWNGPMGVFEMSNFANGTLKIARALADATRQGATTIVGGGDSVAAVTQMGLDKNISHVSTGGGASLEYLEGKILPGIAALNS